MTVILTFKLETGQKVKTLWSDDQFKGVEILLKKIKTNEKELVLR